jgi:hypothetical protein
MEMNPVVFKLRQLRALFVVYFIAKMGAELSFGADFGSAAELGLGRWGIGPGELMAISLGSAALLFALGWWVFHHLLLLRHWARMVLLIVAWLAVLDALSSFLVTTDMPGLGNWLGRLAPGVAWGKLFLLDRITDVLGLFYWGFAIYVLQLDAEVKREFFRGEEPVVEK